MQLNRQEEDLIAQSLKKAYNSKDLQAEAMHLKKLGETYLRRAQMTKDGMDFVKAAGLYNAALARYSLDNENTEREKEELLKYREMVESAFIKDCVSKLNVQKCSFENAVSKHKKNLKDIREKFEQKLKEIVEIFPAYEKEQNEKAQELLQQNRNEAIYKLYKEITRDMIEFIRNLIKECLYIMGEPPCEFAFIGLGSLATEVMTPYSDFEGAILVEEDKENEENKQYFRDLTYLLYIKIINLGETILPTLCIRSLCGSDGYTSWFQDFITPRGFAMDGQVPWASKTPLGRRATDKVPEIELIGGPSKIFRFCADDDLLIKVGYDLPNALLRAVLIEGSEELFRHYNNLLKDNLKKDSEFRLKHSLLKMFPTVKDFGINDQFQEDRLYTKSNVKNDVYRLPSLVLSAAGILYNFVTNNPWEIIERMVREGLVNETNRRHLSTILSIVGELRLKVYFSSNKQESFFSGLPQAQMYGSSTRTIYHIKENEILYHLYSRLLPFEKSIVEFLGAWILNDGKNVLDMNKPKMFDCELYDKSGKTKALIKEKLFDLKNAEVSLKQYIGKNPDDIDAVQHLGILYHKLGNSKKAKEIYQNLNEISGNHDIFRNLALALNGLGEHKKALEYNEMYVTLEKQLYGENAASVGIAISLNHIGVSWLDLGDPKKALVYFEKSFAIRKKLYGESAAQPDIAGSLNNLGNCWMGLGNPEKAIEYLEKSLPMKKKLYGESVAHPDIVRTLNLVGLARDNLGDRKKAIEYIKASLAMSKQLYGEDAAHRDIAVSLNNLGNRCDPREAIEYLEMSLAMTKRLYGESAAHPDIATCLNNIGNCWLKLGNHMKAIEYYEMSLTLIKQSYGESAAPRILSYSLQPQCQLGLSR